MSLTLVFSKTGKSDSQGHSTYISIKNELTYEEHFLLVLKMGHCASAKTHFDVLGDFAFSFLQNCRVKCLDCEDSDSQGHSKYISIERMS